MSRWTEFGIVTGGATAALLGLLFVAVSLRIDVIVGSADLRNRSTQTLSLLLTGLLAAVLLTIPEQARWVLGAEFVALAVATAVTALVLDRRAQREAETSMFTRLLENTTPNVSTCVLLGCVGVTLLVGHDWGLYFLVPAIVSVLAGGVINAWLILIKLTA